MEKLPPVVRPPVISLREAIAMVKEVRKEPPIYDMVEVLGASGSLAQGFDLAGFKPADSVDVRRLALPSG